MARWRRGIPVFLLCVALAGCAAPVKADSLAGQGISIETRTLPAGHLSRTYLAVRPEKAHSGLPLLVVLHGRGVDVRNGAVQTGFLGYAEQGLADIVYPAGIGQSWNAGSGCCGIAARQRVDDTSFIAAVVADAAHAFTSDPRRVYLVGYSNGGRLAFHLACVSPGLFAAFATYGAAPPAPCTNPAAKGLSALVAAGTGDRVLGHGAQVAEHASATWRTLDACPPASSSRRVSPAVVTTWTGCAGGSAVQSLVYSGVTHAWPAGATGLMWTFLSGQVRRTAA
ncbi:CE1 family esterase [Amycolatopsis thermophila]|uniref:Polyhydroxybutyrate depolymerase n=1 Tax=Amycolatopsis thermophila TaxID=206084 RepID=A0ABU0ELM9_9PSEU|nr:PHB depolymerase family esterase [Amycolatopsis thermophila]MDQ0376182.1 polyhydroxybutyrate depolymerase [Amycolatopsis thermophila]